MQYSPRWDLSTIPDDLFQSESGRRRRARTPGATNPKVLRPCPRCGVLCGARELKYVHPKVCVDLLR